jgi:oligopeptide/dipeptide ABC transporter ATP-binding protein
VSSAGIRSSESNDSYSVIVVSESREDAEEDRDEDAAAGALSRWWHATTDVRDAGGSGFGAESAERGGRILVDGVDIASLRGSARRNMRRRVQAVFQDPYGSLDPRMRVGPSISEVVGRHHPEWSGSRVQERTAELLEMVGLDRAKASAYPRELSGGQRQRVGIARAFAPDPDLIVADEPVSALDVSIQAQVVNVLMDLQSQTGGAYLLIAHGLALVKHISDQVGVMYLGKLVEFGPSDVILSRPVHHYTRALMAAAPEPVPGTRRALSVLSGEPGSAGNIPSGCRFRTRCAFAQDRCAVEEPSLETVGPGHLAACFYPAS